MKLILKMYYPFYLNIAKYNYKTLYLIKNILAIIMTRNALLKKILFILSNKKFIIINIKFN